MKLYFFVIFVSFTISQGIPLPEPERQLRFLYFPQPTERKEIIYNDTQSLASANLKQDTRTMLILDGFTSWEDSPMNRETKDAYSGRPDLNVIIVDWGAFSGYGIAFDNQNQLVVLYLHTLVNEMPKAASQLADFIEFITANNNISYQDIILIGGSLGCHTAGATGRATISKFNKTVGRIISLDASRQFTQFETPYLLQNGDAEVIESYITDRQNLGSMTFPAGDVNIYVNGGDNQPCEDGPPPEIGSPCNSHQYSYKLYNYLAANESFKACPCSGAACLCQGCNFECGDDAISVGLKMPQNARGSFHLKAGVLDWGAPADEDKGDNNTAVRHVSLTVAVVLQILLVNLL